jgi:membrane protease YdiL (CAAX protease family)
VLAVGTLALALPVVLLLQSLCVTMLTHFGHPPDNQRAVEMFLAAKTVWARSYFAFFAIVLAPVAEEFIFRGVLYPFIKQQGWPRAAFIGVSALFAFIHFDAATFIPLFALALVLTWIYEKTDCLLASITAHSLFNTTNVVVLYFMPQINDWLQHTAQTRLPQ